MALLWSSLESVVTFDDITPTIVRRFKTLREDGDATGVTHRALIDYDVSVTLTGDEGSAAPPRSGDAFRSRAVTLDAQTKESEHGPV